MSDSKLKVGQLVYMPRGNPQHPEMNRAEPVFVISDDGGDKVCVLMRRKAQSLFATILGDPSETIEFAPRELLYETEEECEGPGMKKSMKYILELQEQGLAPMCDCDVHKRN